MRKIIKDNMVLSLGVSLPVLLVLVFLLASTLPQYFVDDPTYDVIFSDGRVDHLTFFVKDQKLYMKILPKRYETEIHLPKLYRYSVGAKKVEEIAYTPPDMTAQEVTSYNYNTDVKAEVVIPIDPKAPPTEKQAKRASKLVSEIRKDQAEALFAPVLVKATEKITLDTSVVAPDGYRFSQERYHSGGGLLLLGFGGAYYDRDSYAMLTKSGKKVPLYYAAQNDGYYYYCTPNFIGWVIP